MPVKVIDLGKYKHFAIAFLEDDGKRFFRIRGFDPRLEYGDAGHIEYLDVNTARNLARFIGRNA